MEDLLSSVQEERKKYGKTMNDDECARLSNDVAWKHRDTGWGVSGKRSGTRGHLPNGTEIAHDVLHHRPTNTIVDILIGAGAQATPVWNVLGVQANLGERPWVAPVDPATFNGGLQPNPVPVAPPPPPAPEAPAHNESAAIHNLTVEIAALREEVRAGAAASARIEERLRVGLPLKIKTAIGKIVGVVGG